MYTLDAAMENGIASVAKNAHNADVVEAQNLFDLIEPINILLAFL